MGRPKVGSNSTGHPAWLDARVPVNFWQDRDNRKAYLRWLGEMLGYESLDDWYRVSAKDFSRHRGSGLLFHLYGGSLLAAVEDCYPTHAWHGWLFVKAPQSFWFDVGNHRRYLKWLGKQLGYPEPADWYRLTRSDLVAHHGAGLFVRYRSSIYDLVTSHFPDETWHPWLFQAVPLAFWKDIANRRAYLKWLGKQVGFKKPEDWYGIQKSHLERYRGSGLLSPRYYRSAKDAARELYPEFDWKPWLFGKVAPGFWDKKANRRAYLTWLGDRLGFRRPEDWYRVTWKDFVSNAGATLLSTSRSSIYWVLKDGFPGHRWDRSLLATDRSRRR